MRKKSKTINEDFLYLVLYHTLSYQKNYAVISRIIAIELLQKKINLNPNLNLNRIINIKNTAFINTIERIAKELDFNYVIYKYGSRNGKRDGKFYFFKDLNEPMAQALLHLSKIYLIKVK